MIHPLESSDSIGFDNKSHSRSIISGRGSSERYPYSPSTQEITVHIDVRVKRVHPVYEIETLKENVGQYWLSKRAQEGIDSINSQLFIASFIFP